MNITSRYNIFTRRQTITSLKNMVVFTVIAMTILSGAGIANSATYTAVQTNWSGGVTANTVTHNPTDLSTNMGTEYSAQDASITTINGGTDLQLSSGLATTTQSAYPSLILAEPSLVSYYQMNNDWTDSKGSSDATAQGGATFGTAKYGSASGIFNNATNDYVTSASTDFDLQTITVESWVHLTEINTFNEILGKGAGDGTWDYRLMLEDANGVDPDNARFYFSVRDSESTWYSAVANITGKPELNTWYHVVGTYDGAAIKIYVNGVLEGSYEQALQVQDTGNDLYIGRWLTGTRYFTGRIDEPAIYNTALSASAIADHYASRFRLPVSFTTTASDYADAVRSMSPTSYYRLDGTLADEMGAHVLTYAGTTPTYTAGIIGANSIDLDGAEGGDNYFTIDTALDWFPSGGAVSLVFSPGSTPSDGAQHTIWQNSDNLLLVDTELRLCLVDGNLIFAGYWDGGYKWNLDSIPVTPGKKYHITIQANTTEAKMVVIDEDGVVTTRTTSGSWGLLPEISAYYPEIGSWTAFDIVSPNNHFDGIVGELAFYSTPLSAENIALLNSKFITHTSVTVPHYATSSSLESAPIDLGFTAPLSSLSFDAIIPSSTTLTIDVRAGDTAIPDGTWTAWTTDVSSGSSIASLGSHQYIQYRANASTTNNLVTPQLTTISVIYQAYPSQQTLISSPYNSDDVSTVLSNIQWTNTLPEGTTVKFQFRSSPDNSTWSEWMGTDGTSNSYFTNPAGGEAIPEALLTAGAQWFQYKAFLTSTGLNTPTLSDVTTSYRFNARPEFSTSSTALQVATSTDPNWGKVLITYDVRDIDTESGIVQSGFITPSFEYNIGGGWQAIDVDSLAIGDTENKAVSQLSFTPYTAIWDAQSQIPDTYSASAQIRVTASDEEPANPTGQGLSNAFILDTKDPVTPIRIQTNTDSISYTVSDDSDFSYRLSNNSTLDPDGQNATSGQWIAVTATSSTVASPWLFTVQNYPTVYAEAVDAYGNTSSSTLTAPIRPANFDFKDTSNTLNNEYREFISWKTYVATTSAAFNRYELYRSTDGSTFTLHSTITDPAINYYTDSNLSTSTTYYYRMNTVDSDGDVSLWSNIISDLPDGQGGTDMTAPRITAVSVADTQSTWAKLTVTTDELAFVTIEYGPTNGSPYSLTKIDTSVATDHTIVLSGLTPNTDYTFRVKARDIFNNQTTDDNNGVGYAIATARGPVISDVAVQMTDDKSATITWNTNVDSDSTVVYATNISDLNAGTGVTTIAEPALVGGSGPVYQHRLVIPNLSARTTYFFSVSSTDASENTSIDKNNLSYYTFTTTYDAKAPVVSNILTPVITSTSIIVLWNTDELSDSQVSYGTRSGIHASTTDLDATQSVIHAVTLSGLLPDTPYYFSVISNDSAGNSTTSAELTARTTLGDTVKIVTIGGGSSATAAAKDSIPPTISNIQVASTTAFSTTLSFDTNEPTIAFIRYGISANYGLLVGSELPSTHHEVSLSNLLIGTEYHFKIKALDKAFNESTSEDQTFKTKYVSEATDALTTIEDVRRYEQISQESIESILPSIRPPFIEKPVISNITENSATISWRTNIKAYGTISYGVGDVATETSTSLTPYTGEVSDLTTKTTDHELQLVGLKPNTKYHFQVRSFSLPQIMGKADDMVFFTKSSKESIQAYDVKNTSVHVTWHTPEPTSFIVQYRNLKTGEINRKVSEGKTQTHDMVLDRLNPATTYELSASGYTAQGDLLASGETINITTSRDITAPKISNFKVDGALVPGRTDKVQTVVTWLTDELSNSTIYYQEGAGVTEGELAKKVEQLDTFTGTHAIILSDLKPGVIYQMKVESVDSAGNKAVFGPRTIITPQKTESIFDVIFKNFEDTFKFLRGAGQ